MRTALGWAAETINSLARFTKELRQHRNEENEVRTELPKIALLAANNNTHLQLASSNNFRSNIVLRQPAVQGVQLVRTSDELLCGKDIWSKSNAKKN